MSQETQFRCCGDGRSLLGESLQKHLSARHVDQLVTQGKTVRVAKFVFFLLIGIHSMQGWAATTRHQDGVLQEKEEKKD